MKSRRSIEESQEIPVPMQRGRTLLVAAGAVSLLSYSIFLFSTTRNDLREDEKVRRELAVRQAADTYLDVIEVTELSRNGDSISAQLVIGAEALEACTITYERNPNDYGTFDPSTLDLSQCLDG